MDQRVTFVTGKPQLDAVDEWRRRQPRLMPRNEAIRFLINQGLRLERQLEEEKKS